MKKSLDSRPSSVNGFDDISRSDMIGFVELRNLQSLGLAGAMYYVGDAVSRLLQTVEVVDGATAHLCFREFGSKEFGSR